MGDEDRFEEKGVGPLYFQTTTHQFEELSKKIIGAAIEVPRELGPGFLESIYEQALKVELTEHGIHYYSQKDIKIR